MHGKRLSFCARKQASTPRALPVRSILLRVRLLSYTRKTKLLHRRKSQRSNKVPGESPNLLPERTTPSFPRRRESSPNADPAVLSTRDCLALSSLSSRLFPLSWVKPTQSVPFGLPVMIYTKNSFAMHSYASWIPALVGMKLLQVYSTCVRQQSGCAFTGKTRKPGGSMTRVRCRRHL